MNTLSYRYSHCSNSECHYQNSWDKHVKINNIDINLNSSLESWLNRITANERLCTRDGAASVNLVTKISKQPATTLQIPAGMSTCDAD